MTGSIVRAFDWDYELDQRYLTFNREEVSLYRTTNASKNEDETITKQFSRGGFDSINCIGYSPKTVGLTGVGQINGSTHVFDITSPNSNVLKITPKQPRACNAVSFNKEGLVAIGLDKARQDHSLQLWSVEHYAKTGNNTNAADHHHLSQPLISYIQNEVILSATFHPYEPTCLFSGSYKFLREFDLRSDQHVFQLGTRCTSGISVDPLSPNFFASYSEDGTLCIWDRRKLTSSVKAAKSVGSATALNTTGVVHDAPLLTFNKLLNDSRKGTYSNACFRYSPTRRGEFSTLFNGELIRRWNTGTIPPSEPELRTYQTYLQNNQESSTPSTPKLAPPSESLFVVSVKDTKTKYERVVSFDYAADPDSPLGINFICMRQSGSLYRMSVTEAPSALEFNSFNDITFSGTKGAFTQLTKDVVEATVPESATKNGGTELEKKVNGARKVSGAVALKNNTAAKKSTTSSDIDSELNDEDDYTDADLGDDNEDDKSEEDDNDVDEVNRRRNSGNFIDAQEVLENDISSTIRRRAMLGYGTDSSKNVTIIEQMKSLNRDTYLRNTWKWLDISRESSMSNSMVSNNIDFAYEGVLGIWNGLETFADQNRSKSVITEKRFDKAVKDLVNFRAERRQALSIDASRDSKKAAQRRFCLYIAGWDFTKDELNQKLELLTARGQYEKAAGWAVFHGDVPRAVEILAESKKERLRIMSTAIAGYMAYRDIQTNSPWKEQCRRMASELDNPYLRAIFAFIADNDWWDVFDEGSLPLREKIGVALRFLSDKDLSVFLKRLSDNVVSNGDLEGLILTGITPRGIDLLQCYVDKTSDVQTASLFASFACPRFFEDERVDTWVSCYRSLLNSWGLFYVRAKFDVARTKLSKTYTQDTTLEPAPRQVYLQCFRCNKNIYKTKKGHQHELSATNKRFAQQAQQQQQQQQQQQSKAGGKWDSNSCPHCGAPFPRCAICLLSLGTSLPDEVTVDFSNETDTKAIGGQDLTTTGANGGLTSSGVAELQRIDKAFREWFSFCLTCNHGMHAGHAEEWFSKHYVCAVPDCNCRCNSK